MRRIVSGLFMSLDGVAEKPHQWRLPFDAETSESIGAGFQEADAVLLGRNTYLEFAEFWPNAGSEVPMADFLNNTQKYVVSGTLQPPLPWANSTLLGADLAAELAKLKEQPGKDILVPGSPRLVASLLRDGLLDELRLLIQPVVVGSGRRLFDEIGQKVSLDLTKSAALSNGVLTVTYQPSTR
jgi:dihydrofolate reductase